MAAQTRCGVAGISRWVMLWPPDCKASITALITVGGDPIAPASPQPLTPKGHIAEVIDGCHAVYRHFASCGINFDLAAVGP